MATPRMDITSFVGKLLERDDVDALREGVQVLAQAVMETEVSAQIGAAPYERSSERVAYRNGYRTRRWDTRVGSIELKIPKVSAGAYFPSLLEPRRRAEKALHAGGSLAGSTDGRSAVPSQTPEHLMRWGLDISQHQLTGRAREPNEGVARGERRLRHADRARGGSSPT
jgi:Transposase, Mutator family